MPPFKGVMEISAERWLQALRLSDADIPDLIIVEGSWWRKQRTAWRLSYLADVRELEFQDIFWGRRQAKKVVYCCAYGAPRTAEIIHLFGQLGAKLAVQIGTCGGLQDSLSTGDIVLPHSARCHEGLAHLYGAHNTAFASMEWVSRADVTLANRGHRIHQGAHMTWPTLFAQNGAMIEAWQRAGYLSVDMETATTFAVAQHFGVPALSMLVVWDDLTQNRTFLDPLEEGAQSALDRGNQSVFEVALALTDEFD